MGSNQQSEATSNLDATSTIHHELISAGLTKTQSALPTTPKASVAFINRLRERLVDRGVGRDGNIITDRDITQDPRSQVECPNGAKPLLLDQVPLPHGRLGDTTPELIVCGIDPLSWLRRPCWARPDLLDLLDEVLNLFHVEVRLV